MTIACLHSVAWHATRFAWWVWNFCVLCAHETKSETERLVCVFECGRVFPVRFIWGQQNFLCVLDPDWPFWLYAGYYTWIHIALFCWHVRRKLTCLFWYFSLFYNPVDRLHVTAIKFSLLQVWELFFGSLVCAFLSVSVFSTWSLCRAWHSCSVTVSVCCHS